MAAQDAVCYSNCVACETEQVGDRSLRQVVTPGLSIIRQSIVDEGHRR